MSHKANDQITDDVKDWWDDPEQMRLHQEQRTELDELMWKGLDDSVWTDFFRSQTRKLK